MIFSAYTNEEDPNSLAFKNSENIFSMNKKIPNEICLDLFNFIDMSKVLCNEESRTCQIIVDDKPLYYDGVHITKEGVEIISTKVLEKIKL